MPRLSANFQSTAISRGTYDTDTQTLELTFATGRSYTFENVPEDIWTGLESASSPGTYFAQNIKGRY